MQTEAVICHRMWNTFELMARCKCQGQEPLCWMCVTMSRNIIVMAWVLDIKDEGPLSGILDALTDHMRNRVIRPPAFKAKGD